MPSRWQAHEYLIFWASTIPGRFPHTEESGDTREDQKKLNHRIYMVTTRDFLSYSPTTVLYDGGFNVIDATIVRAGPEFVMIVKDETKRPVAKKHLRLTRASRATAFAAGEAVIRGLAGGTTALNGSASGRGWLRRDPPS
jgi:hypothetical protein